MQIHIHRISEALLAGGIYEPREIEITERYSTFDSAINEFLRYINLMNITEYFPHADKQMLLFEREE